MCHTWKARAIPARLEHKPHETARSNKKLQYEVIAGRSTQHQIEHGIDCAVDRRSVGEMVTDRVVPHASWSVAKLQERRSGQNGRICGVLDFRTAARGVGTVPQRFATICNDLQQLQRLNQVGTRQPDTTRTFVLQTPHLLNHSQERGSRKPRTVALKGSLFPRHPSHTSRHVLLHR